MMMVVMRRWRRMVVVGGERGEGGGRGREGKWVKLPTGREEGGVVA